MPIQFPAYALDQFALEVTSAPAIEPLTVTEAKEQLRLVGDADNTLIGRLITAAREVAERYTRRALITQTLRYTLDDFPQGSGYLLLPRPKLQSVSSIQYVDTTGTTQTLSSSDYAVDSRSEPGGVAPAYGLWWPTVRYQINAVTVTYLAGYGDATTDIPEGIRLGIAGLVVHYYHNPGDAEVAKIPGYLTNLLKSYRAVHYR